MESVASNSVSGGYFTQQVSGNLTGSLLYECITNWIVVITLWIIDIANWIRNGEY